MTTRHIRVVSNRMEAHEAVMQAYSIAKRLIDDGKRVQIQVGEDADPVSIKQRRFFHGPVLTQISEQVRVSGERYTPDVWKEYFRKLFLPDRFEMRRVPVYDKAQCMLVQPKRATPYRVRSSTEELGVKKYSEHIEKVIAHAATEWAVAFKLDPREHAATRYVRPSTKRIIDAETGEILETV